MESCRDCSAKGGNLYESQKVCGVCGSIGLRHSAGGAAGCGGCIQLSDGRKRPATREESARLNRTFLYLNIEYNDRAPHEAAVAGHGRGQRGELAQCRPVHRDRKPGRCSDCLCGGHHQRVCRYGKRHDPELCRDGDEQHWQGEPERVAPVSGRHGRQGGSYRPAWPWKTRRQCPSHGAAATRRWHRWMRTVR